MSEKSLLTKILKLEEKNAILKQKNIAAHASSRLERSRRKEVEESRAVWRSRFKESDKVLKSLTKPVLTPVYTGAFSERILRHQYSTLIVSLCVSVYLLGNCGLRSTVKVLSCLCLLTGLELGRLPSKSSIENWLKKSGYSLYACADARYLGSSYGLIVDESMVIGQERVLVILGISAAKTRTEALCLTDVCVLYMGVRSSWTGADVHGELQKVMEKEGKDATYVISDKGSTMCKGIKDAGLVRVSDVGHEIARLTEKRYACSTLETFLAEAKACKAKLIMTPMSYLLCPKQRKIARFMNLGTSIEWGKSTLENFDKLTVKEQLNFEWLKNHHSIINELSNVFDLTKNILKIIKNEGLSYRTVELCLNICQETQKQDSDIFQQLRIDIEQYLEVEKSKLPDADTTWHASSDIIESLFGTFKARKATNPLHGVTSFILFLPLMTKVDMEKDSININVKEALESVKMADLKKWNDTYIIENQVVKRKKLFKI